MRLPRVLRNLAFVAGLAGASVLPGHAQEPTINIMTGASTGTYIQFGRDMQQLMSACGKDMGVVETAGSLENFLGVRQRRYTQFGIVQNDVLEYMQTFASQDPVVARTIRGVRIAFPLYEEEVHILARNDISGLRDLTGKRVAIGVEDSGTFLTASLMLSLAGVEPAEKVLIGPADGLEQLKAGNIDAFFYVAGAPASLYSENAIDGAQFHLVPIADDTLRSVYTPSTLPANTYPFQTEPVDLVSVKAVLMTFEYQMNGNAYHRAACGAVSDLSSLILTNLDELKASGHPKWQDVDLTAIPPGWDISGCVNRGISPGYVASCTAPTTNNSPESEANEVYRRSICEVMGC
ncbi:TAXI family TRAP transporter solute-binding subunit [Paracoccus marinaquae]|uniref:TAXI family TRAP transporter solute-binding subunit n=1 Tax=Paracoccus marinaquae TaxID=2841926 RepID=A0ABS6AIZ7_9RHOB|nr:TAXI family TRAP transporter solute-binding subunit [Paracoccus marinaquae]MBU3030528.1 TAXI family TRAP transporter solute-binding subunit [Paracoccus marinaquae]